MTLDRRTFLATPLVFGLDALTGCSGGRAEDALAAALARMRETGRFGIVVVAPEGEPDRIALGRALHRLLENGPADARELLCSVVLVALPRDLAKRRIRPDLAACPLFLLAPDGSLVESASYNLQADPPELHRGMTKDSGPKGLLHLLRLLAFDDAGRRLEGPAARIERELSDAEREALALLAGETWEPAAALLKPHAERLGPFLAWRARVAADPLRSRLRSIFDGPWEAATQLRPGPRLPYGVTVEQGPVEVEDACAFCGMEAPYRGVVNGKFFKFLPG